MTPEFVTTTAAELLEKAGAIKSFGMRFMQCLATRKGVEDELDVIYSFVDDQTHRIVNLRVPYAKGDVVPSVTGLFPNAFMFENEMHDLFGVEVSGISLDYHGGFYHVHVPEPMAQATKRATKAAQPAEPEKE